MVQDTPDIDELEAEAAAIDAAFRAASPMFEEDAKLVVRRRAFLRRCVDVGVISADRPTRRLLRYHPPERLRSIRDAAETLGDWGLVAAGQNALDGWICLDYVRFQLWPREKDPVYWANLVRDMIEAVENDHRDERTEPPIAGTISEFVGRSALTVWWRGDGQRVALLAIDVGERDYPERLLRPPRRRSWLPWRR